MALQSGKDAMITHPLSSVYGSYVITQDGFPVFVTAEPEMLFQNLEGVEFKDAGRVRILLVSSEDWSQDDITVFVWEAMAEHYAGSSMLCPTTLDEWDECIGSDIGFIRWGFDEFDPNAERAKRKADFDARTARLAKFRQPSPSYAIAAE